MKWTKSLALWLLIVSLIVAPLSGCMPQSVTPPVTDEPSEASSTPTGTVESVEASAEKVALMVGETTDLDAALTGAQGSVKIEYLVTSGETVVKIEGERLIALSVGTAEIVAKAGDVQSTPVTVTVTEAIDPYVDVDKDAFYANYTPATSYLDACYRTQHGLMSGDVTVPDQAPTVSEYQPKRDDNLIRNAITRYEDGGNTYVVVDAYGEEVMEIYRGAAYITLEEVAAYVYAFGEIPANHSESKNTKPNQSEWGIYLRLNHTKFTGDTSKYPYEPELPDISGCGGSLTYYEMDIGTTGTDCDPSYRATLYNNGVSITRGAARIVYARFDRNNNKIIEPNEKYVFYTYNHYNDFQEYLNYYGGWGVKFGNISGGGEISSKTNCNPTPYVPVYVGKLPTVASGSSATLEIVCILPMGWRERG